MNLPLQVISCPACGGTGVATGGITCQTCNGEGLWLQTEQGQKLYYPIPEFLAPTPEHSDQLQKILLYGFTYLSLAITLAAFLYIVRENGPQISSWIWQQGVERAIFGVSGLASMYGLSAIQKHQTSDVSLHDLPALVTGNSAQPINLKNYANPRIEELLKQSVRNAYHQNQAVVDENIFLLTLLQYPRIQGILARLELATEPLIQTLKPDPKKDSVTNTQAIGFAPEVRTLIYQAFQEAIEHDFPYLDAEDLLLAFTKQKGPYQDFLKGYDLTYDEVYAVSRWYAGEEERARKWAFWLDKGRARPSGYMNRAWTALPTPFLDMYSQDLTQLAASGKVVTVSVREEEIAHALQILGRTKKNNVLLVGEPGVGKSSVLGAIALRMIEEEVPEILKDKRMVSMDIGALLSGGESAEENMEKVLEEVRRAGNVILVIPEVHTLVGTSGNGALDAASFLSGALSKGQIQIISTATYADYHKYVESNATLSSLLELVEIKEPTVEQAITILEEEAPGIEQRQGVYLSYPAIEAAVTFAKKYIPDRSLPDSAISLLDEAASAVKLSKQRWVMKEQVAQIVEKKTNIPVQTADAQEAENLLHLEEKLHQRIIGQEEAVKAIADALRRARAGLNDSKRPIASFLFVGPTGVGKTEMAKTLADLYFGSSASMIRLDMSEYQDGRAVYKLIGAPAASSDSYTEGGALTQPIREHPFSLILLDELEKAYPDVLNLFLQLLDDGRLTENTGRTVHFNNTIIIATSNAGTGEITQLMQQGLPYSELPKQILRILQGFFKPEFLNRFDAVIPFHPLRPEEILRVVRLMLQDVVTRSAAQQYTVSFTDDAIQYIASIGFDAAYGARPLRRLIQEKVEGLLAKLILEKQLVPGQSLQIDASMLQ